MAAMPPTSARSATLPRALALAGLTAALACGAFLWSGLQETYWWYPETDAYQLWVFALLGLGYYSHRRWAAGGQAHRMIIAALWVLVTAALLSGMATLAIRIVEQRLPGDLLQNYLEGARRVERGSPVYDVAGLKQSVNASPLAISLFYPLRHLRDRDAIIGFLVFNFAMLGLYFAGGCLLVRRIKGRLTLPDMLFPLAAAFTFYTFNRSWRLGQIDMTLLALLTLGLALMPGRESRGKASAPALALAFGLKLVPGLAAGPLLLDWVGRMLGRSAPTAGRGRATWVALFLGTILVVGALAVARVGPTAAADFVRNVPEISQGTTSGNNFSIVARVHTFNDRKVRKDHQVLPPSLNRLGTALTVVTLVMLCLFTWRVHKADLTLLSSVWLAALPFASPVCWDIYFLWCGFLPWLVLWAHLTGHPALLGQARASRMFLGAVLVGSYLLAGTAGNTTYRDIKTGMTVQLKMPAWLDELPLLGHIMILGALLVVAARDHRRRGEAS